MITSPGVVVTPLAGSNAEHKRAEEGPSDCKEDPGDQRLTKQQPGQTQLKGPFRPPRRTAAESATGNVQPAAAQSHQSPTAAQKEQVHPPESLV